MKKYYINEAKKLSKLLKKNKNQVISNKIIQHMYDDLNSLSQSITEGTDKKIACGKGCSYCCNTRVEITEPEAIFIYSYMKENLNEDQMQGIFNKIKEIVNITSKINNQNDHKNLQIPCVFLHNDICGIYEIRPFICREYHSFDLDSCIKCYVELQDNAGALESNKIKDDYYRIFIPYGKIYKENKLDFTANEFMASLLKIHENKNYIKNYFK